MRTSLILALSLLAFVFPLPVYAALAGAAGPIVPGKRLGDVYLQEPEAKVIAKLGKPTGQDMAMGREICVWHLFQADNPTRFDVLLHRNDAGDQLNVTEIRANSNAFATAKGLTVGSRLEDVMKAYPDLTKHHLDEQNIDVYDSVAKGIAFETNGSGQVTAVIVHRPGKESTISQVELP